MAVLLFEHARSHLRERCPGGSACVSDNAAHLLQDDTADEISRDRTERRATRMRASARDCPGVSQSLDPGYRPRRRRAALRCDGSDDLPQLAAAWVDRGRMRVERDAHVGQRLVPEISTQGGRRVPPCRLPCAGIDDVQPQPQPVRGILDDLESMHAGRFLDDGRQRERQQPDDAAVARG